MSDDQAVAELVSHHYFQSHVTPVQLFNRATDPFLPAVRQGRHRMEGDGAR